jgi:NTP pyrophosphatase (non-canonical NTP hydrolase)
LVGLLWRDEVTDTSGYLSTQVYDGKRTLSDEEAAWHRKIMETASRKATKMSEDYNAAPPMTMDWYQNQALSFSMYPAEAKVYYPALGLAGEAGEVADKIKKYIRMGKDLKDLTPLERRAVALELGDVLWYIVALGRDIDYSLEQIAQNGITKLAERLLRGTIVGEGDNR